MRPESFKCPIYNHGDYSTPTEKQKDYFPNIPTSWFSDHQPLGDRDTTTITKLVADSPYAFNIYFNICQTVHGHKDNKPYFLNYIRLNPNDKSTGYLNDFDRKKLEFYMLLPIQEEMHKDDITVKITEKKTGRYRPVHPIFIPMCLIWINVGQIGDRKCDVHFLGTKDKNLGKQLDAEDDIVDISSM